MGLRGATLLAIGLLPACAAIGPGTTSDDSALAVGKSLSESDLRKPLTKAMIKSTNDLDADQFEAKWQDALHDDAQKFMRAFPGAFHLDLKQVPIARLPGQEGLCVGDAHPDNFGFLSVDGSRGRTAIYAFDDLDDSGRCPVVLDALRYYAIFRLYFDDNSKFSQSLEHYVDTAFGDPSSPIDVAWHQAKDDAPDWSDVLQHVLHGYVDGDSFRSDLSADDLVPVSASKKAAVTSALERSPSPAGIHVLDVGERPRTGGGSGGLTRYWAYVAPADGPRTILELKETAKPGVDYGHSDPPLSSSERLGVLKHGLWGTSSATDNFPVTVDGTKFLVRDRARWSSVDPKDNERDAQAKYLGALHHDAWRGVKKDDARQWLDDSSKLIAKRWKSFFQSAKDAR